MTLTTTGDIDKLYEQFIIPEMTSRIHPFQLPISLIESIREKLHERLNFLPPTVIGTIDMLAGIAMSDADDFRKTIMRLSGLDPIVLNQCMVKNNRIVSYVKDRDGKPTLFHCNIRLPV